MENGRAQFPFPYQPYSIQEEFMQALYSTLDQSKVGIFESPTGTVCLCRREITAEVVIFYWWFCVFKPIFPLTRASLWVWYVERWAGSQTLRRGEDRRQLLCCRKERQSFLPLLLSPPPPARLQCLTGSQILFKKRQNVIWCQSWR